MNIFLSASPPSISIGHIPFQNWLALSLTPGIVFVHANTKWCNRLKSPTDDFKSKFIEKNKALLAALQESDIPSHTAYHINLTYVARHRIAVAERFKGKPKGLVGQVALPFTNSKTVEDLLQEVEEEMTRLEEYNSQRLWCISTEELNERIAARIRDAESNE